MTSAASGLSTKTGRRRQIAAVDHLVQGVDDRLGAADGEGGDDHPATAIDRAAEEIKAGTVGLVEGLVMAIPVGAFHQEHVDVFRQHRIAQERRPRTTDIAGEHQPQPAPVLFQIEHHPGRTQDVAGVDQSDPRARDRFEDGR